MPRPTGLPWLIALAMAPSAAACLAPAEPDSRQQAIIGGTPDPGDPAVGLVLTVDGRCTGTLIAPHVVLTAAHCIDESRAAGVLAGTVSFGPGEGEFVAELPIVDLFTHPWFDGTALGGFDLGAVRLGESAPSDIPPAILNDAPITREMIGRVARAVGFGVSDAAAQSGAGIKRTVDVPIADVDDEHLLMGDGSRNTCQGDSGGPVFLDLGAGEVVVGVTSFGHGGCAGPSRKTRVDRYVDEVVREVTAAWDGACAHDGRCVSDGCGAFADPDCDVCGLNGVCGADCPGLDLDCPDAPPPPPGCAIAGDRADPEPWLVCAALILLMRRRL